MKKLLGLLLMGAAMFSSCGNDHEDLYDPNAAALMKANEYSKAFIAKFGNIDPNHTWGFGDALGARYANTNSNEWEKTLVVPSGITDDEKEAVLEVFNKKLDPTQNEVVNWSDFFVLHVCDGNNSYTTEPDQNGKTQTITPKLDLLSTAYSDGNNIIDDHVNNFNHTFGSKMYMYNSGTLRFGYCNGQDGGKRYYDYVIRKIDGSYYVGFDYSCNDPNTKVVGDGIFNDWIVKIVPAEYKNAKRIIAEDLGDIGDFDFNDVVFDVYIEENDGNTDADDNAVVTLLAAGGTLPLYVAGKEVHELFGVSPDEMVNTGKGPNRTPVIFRVPNISNILNIEIKVVDGDSEYELEVKRGKAAQKICVSTDFEYPAERVNINTIYTFEEYSQNQANELKKR